MQITNGVLTLGDVLHIYVFTTIYKHEKHEWTSEGMLKDIV